MADHLHIRHFHDFVIALVAAVNAAEQLEAHSLDSSIRDALIQITVDLTTKLQSLVDDWVASPIDRTTASRPTGGAS